MARAPFAVLHAALLLTLLLLPPVARALPGDVLGEQKISDTQGGLVTPLVDGDNLGISAVGIGDLDRDGVPDLAVGAQGDDDGASNTGAVYILFLNADGTVKAEQKISATQGGFTGLAGADDRFGTLVEPIGDLDGDGVMDLAVGARRDDDGGTNRGAVWILFLNTDGTVKAQSKISHTTNGATPFLGDSDSFSTPAAIGDLDGDGNTDLAVGAWGDDSVAGAVWILFMLPDGTAHHVSKIAGGVGGLGTLAAGDRFGATVEGIGDLDGDGVPDIVVGADQDSSSGTQRGAIYVLFMNPDGTVKGQQKIGRGLGGFSGFLVSFDWFGLDVARLGDIDGDSVPDIAVGARNDDDDGGLGGFDRGAVWVLFLNPDGTVKSDTKISQSFGGFVGPLGEGDSFGHGLGAVGDLDGDGTTELAVGALLDDDGGSDRGAVWILNLDGSPMVCGNAVLDPLEECDDGGTADFDGCSASCELEDDLEVFGVAATSGLVSVEVDGVPVNVAVSSGDSDEVLAGLIATLINATPALAANGTTAQAVGTKVTTNGRFTMGASTAENVTLSLAPGTVLAEQKISDTQGNFHGGLDAGDHFGSSMAAPGDLDGDGVPDLVVGADRDDDGGFGDEGAVYVLFLEEDGTVRAHQKISNFAGDFPGGLDTGEAFGFSATSLGDLDGDGVGDIAVGARGDDDGGNGRGAVWILFLEPDGTVRSHQKISDTQGNFAGAMNDLDLFGTSVASLGDIDGDGVGDLAVGASGDNDGEPGANGAIWVLFLRRDGTVKSHQKISTTQGGFVGVLASSDEMGEALAALGDLDGDGVGDLAMGVPGGTNNGDVWILFLESDGTVKHEQPIGRLSGGFTGYLDEDFATAVAAVGDVNGDGIQDLLVGARADNDGGFDRGALWVLFLDTDGTVKGQQKISDVAGGFGGLLDDVDWFGFSAARVGDLDEDGFPEIAVGTPLDDDGGFDRGATWILSLDAIPGSVCGDLIQEAPETCDDGNASAGDGCYLTCEIEHDYGFGGTAQGGVVIAVVNGVAVLIVTSPGDSAEIVAQDLADAINLAPALMAADISAVALSAYDYSNGTFDSVTTTDPGITLLPEPGTLTMLAAGGWLLFALAHGRRRATIHAALPLAIFLLSPAARALPGDVLDEQKISDTQGGLAAPLVDGDNFGISAVGIGDLDQDGVPDVAVGAQSDDDGDTNTGAVYILFLNADGTVKAEQKISATQGGFTGFVDGDDRFGTLVEPIGDLDGDGVMDLAVGARRDDDGGTNRGAVWILFLNTDGTVKTHQKISHSTGGETPILADFDNFSTPAAIGDLDGDGLTELAVGAWGSNSNEGTVWIFFLLPDGTAHHRVRITEGLSGFTGPLDFGDRFGATVEGIGDLDGDGVRDIVVGADQDPGGGTLRGAVWVLFLNTNGTVKAEQKIGDGLGGFSGSLADVDQFGLDVARLGDLDGDGIVDIAVGTRGDDDDGGAGGLDRGATWVLFLNADGTVKDDAKISQSAGGFVGPLAAGDRLGHGLGALGDLDGDGITDLAAGALEDDDGGADRGAVWILNLDGSPLVCGDAVLDPGEECDDGGTADFDGCTAGCELEEDLEVFGLATASGVVGVEVDGVSVNVAVSSGDTPEVLAGLIATLIDATPALDALGTKAQAAGSRVATNGRFTSGISTADGITQSLAPGTVVAEQKISDTEGNFSWNLEEDDEFGVSAAALGDLDGDGVPDLAVGASGDDDAGLDRGAVYVLFLAPDGTVKNDQKISDITGGLTESLGSAGLFGSALAPLGDHDGDGIMDIAVGARHDPDGGTQRGAVWILFLDDDGTVRGHQKISDTEGGFTGAMNDFDDFGSSVASIGDLDGDGVGDLAVGARGDNDGEPDGSGAVWILFLNTDGTVKGHQKISPTAGGFVGPLAFLDNFGEAVAPLGDLDGDGVQDLAAGSEADIEAGDVWILFLDDDGTVKGEQQIGPLTGGFTGIVDDGFGTALAPIGDINGDGIQDLAVGAYRDDDGGTQQGAVWVLFLDTDGTVKGQQKISDLMGGFDAPFLPVDRFGSSVERVGDLDGDGFPELAVGMSRADDGGFDRGATWILSLDAVPGSVCGDLIVEAPETCDDGNAAPGDGCYLTCEVEHDYGFGGTAQGGVVIAVVNGVAVLIVTSTGESAETVAANLADAINATPALMAAEISAVALGGYDFSNGTFDSVTTTDPGITLLPEPGTLTLLTTGWLLIAALARRRRSRAA